VVFGRVSRTAFDILLTLLVLILLGVGVLGWRLSDGPVSLGFLTPVIERALSAGDESLTVDVDDTVLAWTGWRRTLDIRMHGVRALGPKGELLIEVPEITASFSARAMLRGLIAPTSLELTGVHLSLTRTASGGLSFHSSLDPSSGEDASGKPSPLAGLVAELLAPPDPDRALGYLRSVSVLNGAVSIGDEASGRTWTARDAEIAAQRDDVGLRIEMGAVADLGGKAAAVSITGIYAAATHASDVSVGLVNVETAQLASIDPALGPLAGLDVALTGRITLRFDPDFSLISAGFDFSGNKGRLIAASLNLPQDAKIEKLSLRGTLPSGLSAVVIDDARLDLGGGRLVSLRGRIDGLDSRVHVQGGATVRNLPTSDLRVLWPHGIAENARRWVTENTTDGMVREMISEFDATAPAAAGGKWTVARSEGVIRFNGVTVTYLSPMPPVRGIDGEANFTAARFDIRGTGAGVGTLRVTGAQVALFALDTDDEQAAVDVSIAGPLRDALALIDQAPLGYMKKIDLAAADFSGDATVQLALKFPLKKTLKVDELGVLATGQVQHLTQRNAALGQDVTDGDVRVKVDRAGMDLVGHVILGPTPADVELRRNFADDAPFTGRTRARGRVGSAADAAKFGFDVLPYIDGPVDLSLEYTERRGNSGEVALEATLDAAKVSVPEFEWEKAAGKAGAARLRVTLSGGRALAIPEFQIVTEGDATPLKATGRIALSTDGRSIARADLAVLQVGRTDASGSYTKSDKGLAIDVAGAAFDAGPFLRDRTPAAPERPALDLKLDLDRLYLGEDRVLSAARFKGQRSAQRWETAELSAYTGDGLRFDNQVVLVLGKEQDRQALELDAQNAGEFLKALDITSNVIGGHLTATARTDEKRVGRPLAGKLHISEFRLVRAPVLARVLSVALLTGILDSLRGQGIGFSGLDAEFAYIEPRFEVIDARGSGSAIGLTAKGMVDIDAETLDLDGTIVPANLLNSLPARIPLLGELLTGGGGGLFAATYRVTGPFDDPKVSVNPLSTFAPGFLRNLFGMFGGSAPSSTPTDSTPYSEKEEERLRPQSPAPLPAPPQPPTP
jgi:hypothetical protein